MSNDLSVSPPTDPPDKARWFIYVIEPTDFGWRHLPTVKEVFCRYVYYDDDDPDVDPGAVSVFMEQWESAKMAAGIGNVFRCYKQDPRVFILPTHDLVLGFAYQEFNEKTVVISPLELPWLGEPKKVCLQRSPGWINMSAPQS